MKFIFTKPLIKVDQITPNNPHIASKHLDIPSFLKLYLLTWYSEADVFLPFVMMLLNAVFCCPTVFVVLLVVRNTWVPVEQGFFCQDTSLRYPYVDQESISDKLLLLGGVAGPVGSVSVTWSSLFRSQL